jgi:hypothetical protein
MSLSVVVQTMQMSQRIITDECDQKYTSVTYNVAIAKLCIQAEECPKSFYPALTFSNHDVFFKALGKFITDSGRRYL